MNRITAIAFTVLGITAALFWFVTIPSLSVSNPSWFTIGIVTICIAIINISGLVYLIRKRADYGRWLIAAGLCGNGLSLFVIVYALAGSLFLEYVFRM